MFSVLMPEGDAITQAEHRLLVAAMKRRDADDAERILYGHIRRTRLELERNQAEVFHSSADAEKQHKRRAAKPKR